MKDIRITVVKNLLMEDLVKEYSVPGFGLCTKHQVGDEYLSKGGQMPLEFCEEAWAAIGRYAFALAHGAEGFWPGWIPERHLAVVSCNDGLRPVIFKMEVIDNS